MEQNKKNNSVPLGDEIVKVLKSIFDPEIPVDIYELGLIYDVFVNEDNDVKIVMTLTSPNSVSYTHLTLPTKRIV